MRTKNNIRIQFVIEVRDTYSNCDPLSIWWTFMTLEDGPNPSVPASLLALNFAKKRAKNVLGTTYSLTDILGFTTLLVPTMNLMSDIISDYGITSKTLAVMLKGVVLSSSIYGVKSIVKRIKNKIN